MQKKPPSHSPVGTVSPVVSQYEPAEKIKLDNDIYRIYLAIRQGFCPSRITSNN